MGCGRGRGGFLWRVRRELQQRRRLLARLDDPTKHWKFEPGDVDVRAFWSRYQAAYEVALGRCNTVVAPWLVVLRSLSRDR